MNREEILEKLIPIIREVMDSQEEIDEETSMQEDLGIDSLDFYIFWGRWNPPFISGCRSESSRRRRPSEISRMP